MTGIKYCVKCVLQVPLHLISESRNFYVQKKYQSPILLWWHRFQEHGIMIQGSKVLNLVLPLVHWMVFVWITHNLILPQYAWEFRLQGSLYAKINRSSGSLYLCPSPEGLSHHQQPWQSPSWSQRFSPLQGHNLSDELTFSWLFRQIFQQVGMVLKLFKRM